MKHLVSILHFLLTIQIIPLLALKTNILKALFKTIKRKLDKNNLNIYEMFKLFEDSSQSNWWVESTDNI